jgi:hypothetical protein
VKLTRDGEQLVLADLLGTGFEGGIVPEGMNSGLIVERIARSEKMGTTSMKSPGQVFTLLESSAFFLNRKTVPNPLGVLGVLSVFNFPVAVYGWLVYSFPPSRGFFFLIV